jgi:hypothetical protein
MEAVFVLVDAELVYLKVPKNSYGQGPSATRGWVDRQQRSIEIHSESS